MRHGNQPRGLAGRPRVLRPLRLGGLCCMPRRGHDRLHLPRGRECRPDCGEHLPGGGRGHGASCHLSGFHRSLHAGQQGLRHGQGESGTCGRHVLRRARAALLLHRCFRVPGHDDLWRPHHHCGFTARVEEGCLPAQAARGSRHVTAHGPHSSRWLHPRLRGRGPARGHVEPRLVHIRAVVLSLFSQPLCPLPDLVQDGHHHLWWRAGGAAHARERVR
mmetsp:Transcript_19132/g.51483  ORF Transcript_19132/g.51483 Transcript_19132/m.51483 type:complete len:218 (+) Transcript_19132:418-1071(+)